MTTDSGNSASIPKFSSTTTVVVSVVVILFSFFYVAQKTFVGYPQSVWSALGGSWDFRLIWIAGKVWSGGGNPYGPEFFQQYSETFVAPVPSHFWVYPPNWWPLATTFSIVDYAAASFYWALFNVAALIAALTFNFLALAEPVFAKRQVWKASALTAYAMFSHATIFSILLGQTSILVYLGFSLLLYGLNKQISFVTSIATLILLLKPQIGLPVLAACLAAGLGRTPIFVGALLAGLFAMPAFIHGDTLSVAENIISNLRNYNAPNVLTSQPPDLTGFSHLVHAITGLKLTTLSMAFVVLFVSIFIGLFMTRSGGTRFQDEKSTVVFLCAVASLTMFFVPLHAYDFVVVAFFVSAILFNGGRGSILIVIGAAICFRFNDFASMTGLTNAGTIAFSGSLVASIGMAFIAAGSFISMSLQQKKEDAEPPA